MFQTRIDDRYVNSHGGDGMVVATATGSTAYALSCGGPIVDPRLDVLVVAPISPHTLSDRPILVPGSSRIDIQLTGPHDVSAQVTCDAGMLGELKPGGKLSIAPSDRSITLLHPPGFDYYRLLRSKLHWGTRWLGPRALRCCAICRYGISRSSTASRSNSWRGLTVLTGETGAGKSIIVDALELLAGGRAGADVVRSGAERADIAATIDVSGTGGELRHLLDEHSISSDGELQLRRVVGSDGRSRAWLGGQSVPLQVLSRAAELLFDIHGQHEFQSLVRPATQRQLVDGYGHLEPWPARSDPPTASG